MKYADVTGNDLAVRYLGRKEYNLVWQEMKAFTDGRNKRTVDEIWMVEHDPVFTQGQAGSPEHIILPGDIPVVQADRGGQVTYHGPGQLVSYFMLDVKRKKSSPRSMVQALEASVIEMLSNYGIKAYNKPDAPGVYTDDAKIAFVGLRFRKMCSYHGLSLNVDMDLEPFNRINPCGYPGLKVVDMASFLGKVDTYDVSASLLDCLQKKLAYKIIN